MNNCRMEADKKVPGQLLRVGDIPLILEVIPANCLELSLNKRIMSLLGLQTQTLRSIMQRHVQSIKPKLGSGSLKRTVIQSGEYYLVLLFISRHSRLR